MSSGAMEELLAGQGRMEDMLSTLVSQVEELRATGLTSPRQGSEAHSGLEFQSGNSDGHGSHTLERAGSTLSAGSVKRFRTSGRKRTSGRFVAHTLPRSWPASLQPRKLETEVDVDEDLKHLVQTFEGAMEKFKRSTSEGSSKGSSKGSAKDPAPMTARRWLPTGSVIDPGSNTGMVLDLMSLLILAYDLTSLPVYLAWDIELQGFGQGAMWFVLVFWTGDVARNFFTGFYSDGELQTNLISIAKHYLRTWFVMDASLVISDWVGVALNSASSSAKMLRLAKMGRMLRILGVMRMLRFVRVMEELAERSLNETQRLGIRAITILIGVAWLTHLMCCFWYFIGSWHDPDTGATWTQLKIINGLPFRESNRVYQYATSFHWAVAQLTLGSVEIVCSNTVERLFNVLCLLTGLIFGSLLVSSLSAAMVEVQALRKHQVQKIRELRRFLREHLVEAKLSNMVVRQATSRIYWKKPLLEKDVNALALLSNSMREDVRVNIFEKFIIRPTGRLAD